jgi:hypothetical protein
VANSSAKTQKATTSPTGGKSVASGTIITIGLGPCTGTDPYAKHPTLRGECVSGTWFPRARKVESKRPN